MLTQSVALVVSKVPLEPEVYVARTVVNAATVGVVVETSMVKVVPA